MSTLLIYMVKVAVYLAAFYLVYIMMLGRDTAYDRNRAFILLSLALALIFPAIIFHTVKPLQIQSFGKFLSDVFITASRDKVADQSSQASGSGPLQIIYTIYITGVFVFIFKLLIDFGSLLYLIGCNKNKGSRIIRFHGFNTSGFSALGYIFINTNLNSEEAGDIIKHEQNHLRQSHFLDIIFVELVKSLQWFNPIVYFLDRALRAIHEYQADEDCLRSGVPVANYQSLLLNQVFKSRAFNLTNSFSNPSLIKKRMVMMTKKRSSALANLKVLLVIPATMLVFLAISAYKEIPVVSEKQDVPVILTLPQSSLQRNQPADKTPVQKKSTELKSASTGLTAGKKTVVPSTKPEDKPVPPPPPPPAEIPDVSVTEENTIEPEVPFVVVEEMPMFPGGDAELLKYIGEHTQYPQNAKEHNVQGRVIVRFCVTAKGGVSQISILKGVDPELNAEAIRVVQTLPDFKPGAQGGKKVPVWYMVPITFTLK